MQPAIQRIRQKITTTRPWVIVAFALAVGLFIYFAAQGARYWQANGNISAARAEIDRIERETARQGAGTSQLEAQLAAKHLRLENLLRLFDYPTTDSLMAIVSETASNSDLKLASMTVERPKIEPIESLQYYVQPITISVDGPTANVREFLAALYARAPVVVATEARMANLDTAPTTQLLLRFYLSPEPIPVDDEETSG